MIQRACVVVAHLAERVGGAVGALSEASQRLVRERSDRELLQHFESRAENRGVVVLEDPSPSLAEHSAGRRGAGHSGEVGDVVEAGHVAQAAVQQAGVDQHQSADLADVGRVGAIDAETQCVGERRIQATFAEPRPGVGDGQPEIIGDELARRPQPRCGHHLRVDGVACGVQIENELRSLAAALAAAALAAATAVADRRPRRRVDELDEVGGRFGQSAVVGLQSQQHLRHGVVAAAVGFEFCGQVPAGSHRHGQDDVAELLALGAAHHPPHGLHDVHLAVARLHENHGVERRHVHALGEQLGVADHSGALVGAGLREFAQFHAAVESRRCAVEMLSLDGHSASLFSVTPSPPCDQAPQLRVLQPLRVELRAGDGVGEDDGAVQLLRHFEVVALGHAVYGERGAQQALQVLVGHNQGFGASSAAAG